MKVLFHLVTSVGQRKNSESPWGIEPQTSEFRAPALHHWATETLWWGHYEVHMASVLHPARISNIDSVMFVNRIRKIVSFELGKEIVKDIFVLVPSVGQRNIFHFFRHCQYMCIYWGFLYCFYDGFSPAFNPSLSEISRKKF